MAEKTILVEIIGNATQFKKELDSAVASTVKANGGFARMSKAAGLAGLALAGGLAVGLDKSAKAAVTAESQTKALDQALANAHIRTRDFAGGLKQAEDQGHKFGFSNNDVREALTKLVTATKDGHKAMINLSTAEDFARLRHLSLAQASDTMTRAIAGSSRALKALGIDTPKVTTAQDAARAAFTRAKDAIHAHFAAMGKLTPALKEQEQKALALATAHNVLQKAQAAVSDKAATTQARFEELTKRVHGQAAAFSDTAAGGMARYHANMENLQEVIGKGVLPILATLSNKLADFAQVLSEHPKLVKDVALALGILAGALIAVGAAGFIAANAMTLGIGLAVAAVIVGVKELIDHWAAVKQALLGVWDAIKNAAGVAWNAISGVITTAWHTVVWIFEHLTIAGLLLSHWNQIRDAALTAWNGIKSVISAAWDGVVYVFTHLTIAGFLVSHWQTIKNDAVSWVGKIADVFTSLPGMIGRAIQSAAGSGWSLVKSALADIFGPVWKFVKGIFDIHSPSGVFQDLGANVVEGFVKGMTDNAGKVKDAVWSTFANSFGLVSPGPPPKDVQDWLKMVQAPTGGGGIGSGAASSHGLVNQVVQALAWARSHGWHGSVTSGFRTYAEQAALYARYLAGGPLAAPPGRSSHEFGQAVDVTDVAGFARAMASAPPGARLYNRLGAQDPVHFSVTGYAQGAIANKALGLIGEAGPEAIIPFNRWDEGWKQVAASNAKGWSQVSESYQDSEAKARERDARNADRTDRWGKISQDQLNEMLNNLVQLPPGFNDAFAAYDASQTATQATNTDTVTTAIDSGTSMSGGLLQSILDAVKPLHDDLNALVDAVRSSSRSGGSSGASSGRSGSGGSLPVGGAGQFTQVDENGNWVQVSGSSGGSGGGGGGGGSKVEGVSATLALTGALSPPPGMHRDGPFWYSVTGSKGMPAPLLPSITGWLQQFMGAGLSPARAADIAGWWSTHYKQIVKGMATGGIVSRPTLAMIGEAGPEAVVPLSRARGKGGDTYNFNFPNYVGDKSELIDTVYRGLLQKKSRNPNLGLS